MFPTFLNDISIEIISFLFMYLSYFLLCNNDEISLFDSISLHLNIVIYDKKINLKAINTEHVTNITKLQHTPNVVNNV